MANGSPTRRRRGTPVGMSPLPAKKKWQAITLATLLLVPAYVFLLVGVVAAASKSRSAPVPAPYIAAGLALIPFVFVVLAFASGHPKAPGAVLRSMGLTDRKSTRLNSSHNA